MLKRHLTGDPLSPDGLCRFAKPSILINGVSQIGHLGFEDMKLYNIIMALSLDDILNEAVPDHRFHAPAAPVRRVIGHLKTSDNRRLRASLAALSNCVIEFPVMMQSGELGAGAVKMISYYASSHNSEYFEWGFDPRLIDAIRKYRDNDMPWAWIDLKAQAQFKSRYAPLFYDYASLFMKRDYPQWDISVPALRRLTGCENKYKSFGDLRRFVIDPALQDCHQNASVKCNLKVRSSGRGNAANLLSFKFTSA